MKKIRWIALGGGATVVAAGLVGVVLVVQSSGSAACAAPPLAGGAVSGQASYYDGAHNGECSFGQAVSDLYVALSPAEYSDGRACGSYLAVTGPKGSVQVKVVDKCPGCAAGTIDLSRQAFVAIGDLGAGVIPVTYTGVRNPKPGAILVRVRGRSPQFIFDNVGTPLSTVEVQTAAGFTPLQHTSDNLWHGASGSGPFTLRLADVYGRTALLTGITTAATQQTAMLMADPRPPSPAASVQVVESSAPSQSPSPSASPPPSLSVVGAAARPPC